MKRTSLLLAMVLGFVVTFTVGTAFATNWVEVPGTNGRLYIDADSAVKQGGHLFFWQMSICTPVDFEHCGSRYNIVMAKSAYKCEVDLRTPRRIRTLLGVYFDVNDHQIGGPEYARTDGGLGLIGTWGSVSGGTIVDLAISLAKEGQDTGAIPTPVSDR